MWTRRLDRALEAIASCERSLPDLADLFPPDTPKREAIDRAIAAIGEMQSAIFPPYRRPEA